MAQILWNNLLNKTNNFIFAAKEITKILPRTAITNLKSNVTEFKNYQMAFVNVLPSQFLFLKKFAPNKISIAIR